MVIINTSATDVSIQAVSPELGVHFSSTLPPHAGGAASCASATSPHARQRSAAASREIANAATALRPLRIPIAFPPPQRSPLRSTGGWSLQVAARPHARSSHDLAGALSG